jgi:hypothetical protein
MKEQEGALGVELKSIIEALISTNPIDASQTRGPEVLIA